MSDNGSQIVSPSDLRDASRERLLAEIGLLQLWWAQRTIQSSGYLKFRKRNELVTTKILESAIAAPAYMGESNPAAAIGIPIAL